MLLRKLSVSYHFEALRGSGLWNLLWHYCSNCARIVPLNHFEWTSCLRWKRSHYWWEIPLYCVGQSLFGFLEKSKLFGQQNITCLEWEKTNLNEKSMDKVRMPKGCSLPVKQEVICCVKRNRKATQMSRLC